MLEYARWKYILVGVVLAVALLFALPNLFGDDFAIQIARKDRAAIDATQLASIRVGSRRGCNIMTCPFSSSPPSSSICGTCVDFPEPVGAVSTRRLCVRNFSRSGCSISKIGRSDLCIVVQLI